MTYLGIGKKLGPGPLVKCDSCGSNHYAAVLHRCSKKGGDSLKPADNVRSSVEAAHTSFLESLLELAPEVKALDKHPQLVPPRDYSKSNSVRFEVGDRVEVWNTKDDHQYDPSAIPARRANKGKTGEVKAVHDSHGLCYDLRFSDGSTATYSDTEVRRAPPVDPFLVLAGPRKSGKTSLLVRRSARTGEVILCANPSMVANVLAMARNMKLSIPTPLTHSALMSGQLMGSSSKLLIDDLDLLLKSAMPRVSGFTISTDAG